MKQIVDKYPEFGTRDLLMTNNAECESESMKRHDPKFTTMNFCYDYTNTTYFSNPKQTLSTDFFMPFSHEGSSVTIEPKPYVPTLILEEQIKQFEEKVVKLEEEVHKF